MKKIAINSKKKETGDAKERDFALRRKSEVSKWKVVEVTRRDILPKVHKFLNLSIFKYVT